MPYDLKIGYDLLSFNLFVRGGWVNLDDLMDLATYLRGVNFSVVDARGQAIDRIRALRAVVPAGLDKRFPENVILVRMNAGSGTILSNIVNSLSFRDLQKDTSHMVRRGAPTEDVKDQVVGASANDATRSFYKNVQELGNRVMNGQGVYDRDHFESEVGLWLQPAAPGPPGDQQLPQGAVDVIVQALLDRLGDRLPDVPLFGGADVGRAQPPDGGVPPEGGER